MAKTPSNITEAANRFCPTKATAKSIGNPPRDFTAAQRRAWNEIVAAAAPGVLTESDRLHVEFMAEHLAAWRQDRENFPPGKLANMRKLLSAAGMSPSDRSKIKVDRPDDNPFSKL